MAEPNEVPESEKTALEESLLSFLRAPTLEAKREIIQANQGLLTDTALSLMEGIAEAQENNGAREFVLGQRELLHRCREAGVEATFAAAEAEARDVELA